MIGATAGALAAATVVGGAAAGPADGGSEAQAANNMQASKGKTGKRLSNGPRPAASGVFKPADGNASGVWAFVFVMAYLSYMAVAGVSLPQTQGIHSRCQILAP